MLTYICNYVLFFQHVKNTPNLVSQLLFTSFFRFVYKVNESHSGVFIHVCMFAIVLGFYESLMSSVLLPWYPSSLHFYFPLFLYHPLTSSSLAMVPFILIRHIYTHTNLSLAFMKANVVFVSLNRAYFVQHNYLQQHQFSCRCMISFLMANYNSIVYIYYIFYISSPVDGHQAGSSALLLEMAQQ